MILRKRPFRRAIPAGAVVVQTPERLEPVCVSSPVTVTDNDLPPLTGPTNLIWFCWPRRETREIWQAQQEMIRAGIHQFDGLKIAAIAVDYSTEDIDRTLWGEVIEVENSSTLREMTGWRPLMERISREPGATVWLHAKGVARGWTEEHLRRWCELGYETMLHVPRVREALKRSIIAGCFRRTEGVRGWGVDWHFSGSMYAFRNDRIFSGEWLPSCRCEPGWYAEAWPALMASKNLASCIRYDGCGDLYQSKNWRPVPCN